MSTHEHESTRLPAVAEGPVFAGEELASLAQRLVADASSQGLALTGETGLLTALTRQVLQSALEAEMTAHLGYGKHESAGRNGGNSRNGSSCKTITTEIGQVAVDVPRDRDGTFEPVIVRKHQRRLSGFDDAVISLYAKDRGLVHPRRRMQRRRAGASVSTSRAPEPASGLGH